MPGNPISDQSPALSARHEQIDIETFLALASEGLEEPDPPSIFTIG